MPKNKTVCDKFGVRKLMTEYLTEVSFADDTTLFCQHRDITFCKK